MTRKTELTTAEKNRLSLERYLAERADGGGRQPKQAAKQPIRYDGASSPMPKVRSSGDQFHALRRKAGNYHPGKK
jgi:hypothetical protein